MADTSRHTPGSTAGLELDDATQERLMALLQEALAQASDEALRRGATPEELRAQLDARIARLRKQIADLSDDEPPG